MSNEAQPKKTLSEMSSKEVWEEFCTRYKEMPTVSETKKQLAESMAGNINSKTT